MAEGLLFIRNHSSQKWLIRAASGDPELNVNYVRLPQPGAEGLSLFWAGPRNHTIELLELDCSVAGTFEFNGDQVAVSGIDGIDGSVEPYRFNDQWNVPGIGATIECGGYVRI